MGKKNKKKNHMNNHNNQSNQEPQKPQWNMPSEELATDTTGGTLSSAPRKTHNVLWYALSGLILIAIILVLIFVPEGDKKAERKEKKSADQQQEEVASQEETSGTTFMQPITEGDFIYQFSGINWMFESEDVAGERTPVTQVNWMFEDFSRRQEKVIVTFGEPYKMGLVQGECSEVEALEYDADAEEGLALAYASCDLVAQTGTTEFAIFQEDADVVTKRRTYSDAEDKGSFVEISRVDMTEVVE